MTLAPGEGAYLQEKRPGRRSRAPGNIGTVQGTRDRPGTPEEGPDLHPDLRGSRSPGRFRRKRVPGSPAVPIQHVPPLARPPYEARTSCEHKEIGTPYQAGVPISPCEMFLLFALLCQCSSCERWLAARHQELIIAGSRCECIILALEPHKLSFQVSHSLLESAHL